MGVLEEDLVGTMVQEEGLAVLMAQEVDLVVTVVQELALVAKTVLEEDLVVMKDVVTISVEMICELHRLVILTTFVEMIIEMTGLPLEETILLAGVHETMVLSEITTTMMETG